MNTSAWDKLHASYKDKDWLNKPNIFAEEIIKYIKPGAKILELGAGQGQDSRFFAEQSMIVVSTDISVSALEINKSKIPVELEKQISIQELDISSAYPFKDSEFDVVYAHLAVQFFSWEKSREIFKEIHRVLKPGGLLIMLNNSTSDPQYQTGEKIEEDYYIVGDKRKRFFSTESLSELVEGLFTTVLLDAQGETYKDAEKGVHNLIRYVGRK